MQVASPWSVVGEHTWSKTGPTYWWRLGEGSDEGAGCGLAGPRRRSPRGAAVIHESTRIHTKGIMPDTGARAGVEDPKGLRDPWGLGPRGHADITPSLPLRWRPGMRCVARVRPSPWPSPGGRGNGGRPCFRGFRAPSCPSRSKRPQRGGSAPRGHVVIHPHPFGANWQFALHPLPAAERPDARRATSPPRSAGGEGEAEGWG